ncbi:hypothetical protein, partial [Limnohabitans sp.]|uniref:hypothetical protein n=1 Tax=Limnohabitans sp. TaxID=1907725 RepID=UPI003340C465
SGGASLGAMLLAKVFVALAKEAKAAEQNGQRPKAAVARKAALAAKGTVTKGTVRRGAVARKVALAAKATVTTSSPLQQ